MDRKPCRLAIFHCALRGFTRWRRRLPRRSMEEHEVRTALRSISGECLFHGWRDAWNGNYKNVSRHTVTPQSTLAWLSTQLSDRVYHCRKYKTKERLMQSLWVRLEYIDDRPRQAVSCQPFLLVIPGGRSSDTTTRYHSRPNTRVKSAGSGQHCFL